MILRIVLALLWLLVVMNAAPCAYAVDPLAQIHPYISLKEEYRDNIRLTSTSKQDDYITTIQPGINFSNTDAVSGIDLDYTLGAVLYGKNSDLNYISHNASLNAKYLTTAHLNFYLKESFIRSNTPREREFFTTDAENKFVLSTTVDAGTYVRNVVSPTIEYQFGPEDRLGVNYRNNTYRTTSVGAQDSQEHYLSPFFSYWFDKQNGISLDYRYTRGSFQTSPDLTTHRANARYTNRFSAKSSVFAAYSFSRSSFAAPGVDYDISNPEVGLTYAFSPTLTASAQVGYYWKDPATGSKTEDFTYVGELKNLDLRTTYQLSLQGGYTESFFSSQNLGFQKYQRLTGSVTHLLEKRMTLGCSASVERVDYGANSGTVRSISGTASYVPLKWLTLALEASHKEYPLFTTSTEATENIGMFKVTATY